MGMFVEAWANADRWLLLSNATFEVAGGHLMPAVAQANPLLQFRQNVTTGLVVEMEIHPDDDFQLSLVKPSTSISFDQQADITYFGILYEKQYESFYNQFVLNWRGAWGDPLLNVASPQLSNQTTYRLLFSAVSDIVRVKVFNTQGVEVASFTQSGVLMGDMTFLVNPGRLQTGVDRPWIGRSTFLWGATPAMVDTCMAAGKITLPGLDVPSFPTQPSFVEGVYSTWSSPSFGGTGTLSVIPQSKLPDGLSISAQGDRLVIFGAPAAGSSGLYPLCLSVSDGVSESMVTVYLNLSVAPSWSDVGCVVTAGMAALGDYYYRLCGGPLRKEFFDGL